MKKTYFLFLSLFLCFTCYAKEITYQVVSYNADAQDFVLSAFGEKPVGAIAWFENEYGATRGNRYNQIPRNRQASLFLEGWKGCTIKSVTLSMCSNNKAGSFSFTATSGDSELAKFPVRDFADEQWYGGWVSKDYGIYVDIKKDMQNLIPAGDVVELSIKGGTAEGSVYLNAITIEYEPGAGVSTESPLGYVYEKLAAKATLNEGDVLMLYRSGDAAGDIDGIKSAGYLDIIGLSSTGNVYEPYVEHFTLGKDNTNSHWTLTDQYGRTLGAASQKLTWDSGELGWDITLGYDGATIASANEKNGTIRYNIPSEGYGRFALYTSKSLTLPYLYRRTKQNQPVLSTAVELGEPERTINISVQNTVIIKAKLFPASATDYRISWKSDNEEVATVRDGIVSLQKTGDVRITAMAKDGGSQSHILLHIVDNGTTAIENANSQDQHDSQIYNISGMRSSTGGIVIKKGRKVIQKVTH